MAAMSSNMSSAIFGRRVVWNIEYSPNNDRIFFPKNYSTKVGIIPNGILYVEFGFYVTDQICPYDIPDSTVRVKFAGGIQRLTKGILPSGLTHLVIDQNNFRCDPQYGDYVIITSAMPTSVIEEGAIPDSVTHLSIYNNIHIEGGQFPPNLTKLVIRMANISNYSHIKLPPTLDTLAVDCAEGELGDWIRETNLRKLKITIATMGSTTCCYYPETLKKLTNVDMNADVPIKHLNLVTFKTHSDLHMELPDTIEELYSYYLPDVLPSNLRKFFLNCGYNECAITSSTIESLEVIMHPSMPINSFLPNLKSLILMYMPSQDGMIPSYIDLSDMPQLEYFCWAMNQENDPATIISPSLIHLNICVNNSWIDMSEYEILSIPNNVKCLTINRRLREIPTSVEVYDNHIIDADVINRSNVKIFCVSANVIALDPCNTGPNISDVNVDVSNIECMVFYPVLHFSGNDFPCYFQHTLYHSREPLKSSRVSPNFSFVELDHVQLGLSCKIPHLYLYEITPINRTFAKSARK